jgi:hypothetical protein
VCSVTAKGKEPTSLVLYESSMPIKLAINGLHYRENNTTIKFLGKSLCTELVTGSNKLSLDRVTTDGVWTSNWIY